MLALPPLNALYTVSGLSKSARPLQHVSLRVLVACAQENSEGCVDANVQYLISIV